MLWLYAEVTNNLTVTVVTALGFHWVLVVFLWFYTVLTMLCPPLHCLIDHASMWSCYFLSLVPYWGGALAGFVFSFPGSLGRCPGCLNFLVAVLGSVPWLFNVLYIQSSKRRPLARTHNIYTNDHAPLSASAIFN